MIHHDNKITEQINQCIDLLKYVLGHHLLGVYLYGSAVFGGLQKYSDIDLFVVSERATTKEEKKKLIEGLLQISGIYMKSSKLPIELTIVVKSEIKPWYYPPRFDFQYGDWLRKEFENGMIEPWSTKVMPDLAVLITKILLASETLFGLNPAQLLCAVPYRDVIRAIVATLKNLKAELHTDTRNVLLTYARFWIMLEKDIDSPKPAAALWAINRLPQEFKPVVERARLICIGEENEYWKDIAHLIQPCADFMLNQINKQILFIESTGYVSKSIFLDNNP